MDSTSTQPPKVVLRSRDDVFKFFRNVCPAVITMGSNPQILRNMEEWLGDRNPSFQPQDYKWQPPPPTVTKGCQFNEFMDGQCIEVAFSDYGISLLRECKSKFGVPPLLVYFYAIKEIEDAVLELAKVSGMPELRLNSPPAEFAYQMGSKIAMTKMAESVGVRSVPYAIAHVGSLADLEQLGKEKLGGARDMVVQAAHGVAGSTTWFINLENAEESQTIWDRIGAKIALEAEVKVMRRIKRIRASAIEGTVLRPEIGGGVIVGPCFSQLVGFSELTEEGSGGWCGGEACAEAVPEHVRIFAHGAARRIGQLLADKGYWGNYQVDILHDLDTGEPFLGEVNTRFSGATVLTSMWSCRTRHVPIAVYHILSALAFHRKDTTPPFEIGRELIEENAGVKYVSLDEYPGLSSVIVKQLAGPFRTPKEVVVGVYQISEDGKSAVEIRPLPDGTINLDHLGDFDTTRTVAITLRRNQKSFPVPFGSALGRLWVKGTLQDPSTSELKPLTKSLVALLPQIALKPMDKQR